MTTETAVTFQAGDRVRDRRWPEDVRIFDGVRPGYGDGPRARFSNGQETLLRNLELVERAHYAPPGVAMIALTPEVLALFEGIPTMSKHEKIVDAVTAALKADGQQWPSAIASASVIAE